MSLSDEELMAFVDGELSSDDADRVAAQVAADPALGARVDAEKRLRGMLRGHLDPVTDEPVPESLTLLVAAAAADQAEREMIDTPVAAPTPPIDLAAARAKRAARLDTVRASRKGLSGWRASAALAASLVLGLALGTLLVGGGDYADQGGALVASGALAQGLDTQLASSGDGPLRILTSFQRKGGDYCRVYAASGNAGIACKDDGRWVLEHTMGGASAQAGEYRQAGSQEAELMTAAQDMVEGDPLDAAQERSAADRHWRR